MILRGKEAKEKLLKGINQTADVIKSTLGAKGKNVLLVDNLRTGFNVTKDGVSVANKIFLEDTIENCGAIFIQNAARKTVEEAGDATTTTTILTQSMCNKLNTEIDLGKSANELCKDLKADLKKVKDFIKNTANKVENTNHIKQIAKVSANNDEEIGSIIKDIYDKIGFNGTIDVRESDSLETSFEIVKGFNLPNTGFASQHFINNHEKGRVELLNPRVLVFNSKIKDLNETMYDLLNSNAIEIVDATPLVILVDDIEEIALRRVIEALSRGIIHNVVVVQSSLIFETRKNRFKDTAVFLGAEYCEDKIGELGSCERIIIEKDSTTFINGAGDTLKYVKKLKSIKDRTFELEKRIFDLELNAAIINVGGKLQSEISEKKDRIEDAVCAVKSAIEEGYCAGGSTTFLFAKEDLELQTEVMKTALLSCYEQLLINAEIEPYYILRDILDKGYGYGYNVEKEEVQDLLSNGIIDSAKALRVSLENAVSTSCNFCMIESIVG